MDELEIVCQKRGTSDKKDCQCDINWQITNTIEMPFLTLNEHRKLIFNMQIAVLVLLILELTLGLRKTSVCTLRRLISILSQFSGIV